MSSELTPDQVAVQNRVIGGAIDDITLAINESDVHQHRAIREKIKVKDGNNIADVYLLNSILKNRLEDIREVAALCPDSLGKKIKKESNNPSSSIFWKRRRTHSKRGKICFTGRNKNIEKISDCKPNLKLEGRWSNHLTGLVSKPVLA